MEGIVVPSSQDPNYGGNILPFKWGNNPVPPKDFPTGPIYNRKYYHYVNAAWENGTDRHICDGMLLWVEHQADIAVCTMQTATLNEILRADYNAYKLRRNGGDVEAQKFEKNLKEHGEFMDDDERVPSGDFYDTLTLRGILKKFSYIGPLFNPGSRIGKRDCMQLTYDIAVSVNGRVEIPNIWPSDHGLEQGDTLYLTISKPVEDGPYQVGTKVVKHKHFDPEYGVHYIRVGQVVYTTFTSTSKQSENTILNKKAEKANIETNNQERIWIDI